MTGTRSLSPMGTERNPLWTGIGPGTPIARSTRYCSSASQPPLRTVSVTSISMFGCSFWKSASTSKNTRWSTIDSRPTRRRGSQPVATSIAVSARRAVAARMVRPSSRTNRPALSAYVRDLYQTSGVAETVDFHHIKTHYYASHLTINPTGVIPLGPSQDFMAPHDRAAL